jgi:hypothetical protein
LTLAIPDNSLSPEAKLLLSCIKDEFARITLRRWGHFFPIQLATIRFIFYTRPGVIGDVIDARYVVGSPPEFAGRGAEWLVLALFENNSYLDLVESLWWKVAHAITPEILDREFMLPDEIPQLDSTTLKKLAVLILQVVDQAVSI